MISKNNVTLHSFKGNRKDIILFAYIITLHIHLNFFLLHDIDISEIYVVKRNDVVL